jgi:signal transduction histidine kinase
MAQEKAIPLSAKPAKILLVDDDERNLTALESILDSPEYCLVRARSADETLHALMSDDFALLILDVRMPQVDGLELAQIIKHRKKTRYLPIIFLSAYYQEDEHVLQGYVAGAVDYLTKPLNPAVLRSKVAAFVDLFRTNRALQDEIAERREAERRLAERTSEVQELVSQLRALAMELTRTEQRERKHLAKVLHDHMQQLIVSALMQLATVAREHRVQRAAEAIKNVESTLKDALAVSRSVTVELSPPVLHEAGLAAGLKWFAERLREKHQFSVIIRADERAEPANEEERFLLYECTQELLFNSVKHSGVSEASLNLLATDDGRIQIIVEDRGAGFDIEKRGGWRNNHSSFGLFSVQQRLAHLGGALEIQSGPGKGTRVTVTSSQPRSESRPELTVNTPHRESPEPDDSDPNASAAIGVLVVDDHKIFRQALISLLDREEDITVVGEAGNMPDAVELAGTLRPDVIIMDVDLGDASGLQATTTILVNDPGARVLGLSMHHEAEVAAAMRKAGAVAYLTKDGAAEDLLTSIRDANRRRRRD